ncbi:hypothetical protein BGZ46_003942 [Entomortierella lignicola]|nr:hypothetical protein BGZ46_003942 [Entomortierella lignicola]
MAYHQTLLTHVIRPIDQFVLDILGDKRLDDEHLEELLAFASDITNYIQDVSHRIGESRRQNIERALGFEPRKGDRTATESITERKLLNTIRRKFNTNQHGRGNDYGNSRSYSDRNNQQHNQSNNSSYNQTQQSSSKSQNDNGNGSRDFYNAQSTSNRGRGRGRGRGQQPNNPQ